jgi:hypothetical protein
MLPGPFQAPPFPGLPSFISPLVMWLLILGAAVGVAIAFFRVFVAESDERVNAFLVFLLVITVVFAAYLLLMNWYDIIAWFQREIIPKLRRPF